MGKNDIFNDDGKIDALSEWIDGCYDEDGMSVTCDWCDGNIVWRDGIYICRECDKVFERAEYFNYIGADPPDAQCLICDSNYPICKSWCHLVDVSPDDYYF